MYQALYRKWRPKTFSQVVGQDHITGTKRDHPCAARVPALWLTAEDSFILFVGREVCPCTRRCTANTGPRPFPR